MNIVEVDSVDTMVMACKKEAPMARPDEAPMFTKDPSPFKDVCEHLDKGGNAQ